MSAGIWGGFGLVIGILSNNAGVLVQILSDPLINGMLLTGAFFIIFSILGYLFGSSVSFGG
ncbi:MAG: hypothetical protein HYW50_03845 [Candidatus Diapherotrites archaeon]|nr:hypothetical protein [Candidatus Diapherotrites archaeon]